MVQASPPRPVSRDRPMAGSATLTTVASRNAMPDPSTVAASTHRPRASPKVSIAAGTGGAAAVTWRPTSPVTQVVRGDPLRHAHPPGIDDEFVHLGLVEAVKTCDDPVV